MSTIRLPRPLTLLLLFLSSSALLISAQSCDPCSAAGCGGVTWGTKYTTDIKATSASGTQYFFSVCADTAQCNSGYYAGQVCKTASGSSYSLGEHSSAVWTLNADQSLTLVVKDGQDWHDVCGGYPSYAQSTVTAVGDSGLCDDSLTVLTEGAKDNCFWTFTFNARDLCGGSGGGGGSSGGKSGLSGGWIFVIILVVVTFVYCVGGAAFMHYRRGASGTEMVPNLAFWKDLPGLVVDGCKYSWAKVRACVGGARTGALLSSTTGSTYETI